MQDSPFETVTLVWLRSTLICKLVNQLLYIKTKFCVVLKGSEYGVLHAQHPIFKIKHRFYSYLSVFNPHSQYAKALTHYNYTLKAGGSRSHRNVRQRELYPVFRFPYPPPQENGQICLFPKT